MRSEAFLRFVQADLTPESSRSYVSYLQRVELTLGFDLDEFSLRPEEISGIKDRLTASGMAPASVSNCGSALEAYGRFAGALQNDTSNHDRKLGRSHHATPPARTRSDFIRRASVGTLMQIYGDVLEELRERGILRTGNGPIGDYAERLFATAFGWKLTDNSASGHDATDAKGLRYQIKARRITSRNASRQLRALRKLPDRPFDVLAAVLFDEDFGIMRAALLPYELVVACAKRAEHTNSWRLMMSDRLLLMLGVEDVTDRIRTAVQNTDT
jgi:hypothetical protein